MARRQGRIRGAGDKTLRDASSRATKAFYPALSLCDMIFSGVFERHPRLTSAIVEFEPAWAPHLISTMDYMYRERHSEAIYRFKDGMLPSDFFHRNVVSRGILAEILAAVPADEQAKIAAGNAARVYDFDVARMTVPA